MTRLDTSGDRFNDAHSFTRSTLVNEEAAEKRAVIAAEKVRKAIALNLMNEGTLREVFDKIDEDGSGELSFVELKRALDRMGLSILLADASDVMKQIDVNGDGKITYEEFESFLNSDQTEARLKLLRDREISREFKPPILRKSSLQGGKVYRQNSWKPLPNRWGQYPNGGRMTEVRRTSYAFGNDTRTAMMSGENDAHFFSNRESLRQKLQDEMKNGGLAKMFAEIDKTRTGEITYSQFTSACDQRGWSVLHQDAKGLMKQIDTNKNGKISFQELKKFINTSHAQFKQEQDKNREESVRFVAKLAPITPYSKPRPPDRTRHMHKTQAARSRTNFVFGQPNPKELTQLCIPLLQRPPPLQNRKKVKARRMRRLKRQAILRGAVPQSVFPLNRNRMRLAKGR